VQTEPFQGLVTPIDHRGGDKEKIVVAKADKNSPMNSNFLLATIKKLVKFLTKSKGLEVSSKLHVFLIIFVG
jgi:hypothetical protein